MKPPEGARPRPLAIIARTAFVTLSVIAAAGCTLTTAAWFVDEPAIFAQLSPFRLQYAVLLLGHTLFCALMRRTRTATVFATFAALNALAVLALHRGGEAQPPHPHALKIVYANVQSENTDTTPLLALIAAESPDLIALLEINARWDDDLSRALGQDFPHRFVQPREDNFGLALYSRLPLADKTAKYLASPDFASLAATVRTSAGEVRLLLTHPPPPSDSFNIRLRDQQIAAIGKWDGQDAHTTPTVILGDFNATPWCPPLSALLDNHRLRLASRGHAIYAATWPTNLPHLRIPIDHVLLGGRVRTNDFHVGPAIGSDHFPLIVDLGLNLPSPE
ncbi:MAG: endonuclease/exonuclease/phosphatase family protein [Verrucomicrobiota bacterium]